MSLQQRRLDEELREREEAERRRQREEAERQERHGRGGGNGQGGRGSNEQPEQAVRKPDPEPVPIPVRRDAPEANVGGGQLGRGELTIEMGDMASGQLRITIVEGQAPREAIGRAPVDDWMAKVLKISKIAGSVVGTTGAVIVAMSRAKQSLFVNEAKGANEVLKASHDIVGDRSNASRDGVQPAYLEKHGSAELYIKNRLNESKVLAEPVSEEQVKEMGIDNAVLDDDQIVDDFKEQNDIPDSEFWAQVTPVTDLPKGVSHMDKTIVEQHRQALELGVESRITTRDRLNGVDSEASKVPESVHHEQVEKFATSWKIKGPRETYELVGQQKTPRLATFKQLRDAMILIKAEAV